MAESEAELLSALDEAAPTHPMLAARSLKRVLSMGGGRRGSEFGEQNGPAGVPIAPNPPSWLGLVAGAKLWSFKRPGGGKPTDLSCQPHEAEREAALAKKEGVLRCEQHAGEVLLLPANWWRGSCNLRPWTIGYGGKDVVRGVGADLSGTLAENDAASRHLADTRSAALARARAETFAARATSSLAPLPPLPASHAARGSGTPTTTPANEDHSSSSSSGAGVATAVPASPRRRPRVRSTVTVRSQENATTGAVMGATVSSAGGGIAHLLPAMCAAPPAK